MNSIVAYLFFFLCLVSATLLGQVGINTTTPNESSILDIQATDKGVLIPRVSLTSTTDTATITGSEANGLIVYNTVTAGTTPNTVTPGFYFWDAPTLKWTRFITSKDPATTTTLYSGNGTILGNRDVELVGSLAFKRGGADAFRIQTNNKVGINVSDPQKQLDVGGDLRVRTINNAINGDDSILSASASGDISKVGNDVNGNNVNANTLKNLPDTYQPITVQKQFGSNTNVLWNSLAAGADYIIMPFAEDRLELVVKKGSNANRYDVIIRRSSAGGSLRSASAATTIFGGNNESSSGGTYTIHGGIQAGDELSIKPASVVLYTHNGNSFANAVSATIIARDGTFTHNLGWRVTVQMLPRINNFSERGFVLYAEKLWQN